jgi:glycosyltransferase involved in cell wall biosynthesis
VRVLLLHNHFHVRSGAGTGMFHDAAILRDAGHEVHFFCTDARPWWDDAYPHVDLFPRHVDYGALSAAGRLRHALRPFWNAEAVAALDALLERVRPDVVHEHSTAFQLTPAVLRACDRRGVPVVMTIHGAGLFCPAQGLMRRGERPCREESCIRGGYHHALLHGCLDGGPARSLATVLVHAFYDRMGLYRNVAAYLCASDAMLRLATRAGLPAERLHRVPHGFPRGWFTPRPAVGGTGGYLLYAGRLEREKGVHHLLEAMRRLPAGIRLRIAGRGREEPGLRAQAARRGLANVEFVGWREGEELAALYREAIATVLPCNWFEAFGLTIVESFAQGRPVVASRVGGIPEIVEDGVDGLLVAPGDPDALAAALARLHADPALASAMGRRGRATAEARYDAGVHHEALMHVYRAVLGRSRGG